MTTWLLVITRNLAIDRLRMEAARPADPIDPAMLVRRSSQAGPEDTAVTAIETRRVHCREIGEFQQSPGMLSHDQHLVDLASEELTGRARSDVLTHLLLHTMLLDAGFESVVIASALP